MTNLTAAALQRPEAACDRPIARVVARTVALIPGFLVRAYRARRDTEHLMGLSHHLLKDIGLGRGEIDSAVRWGQVRR
jgi:uncharacterized protein YjiS (DUF1127 family)